MFGPALEGVFGGENTGSAGEWMEQEVLLIEEIVDPEIERGHNRIEKRRN
jgi:hypothetical protein